MLSYTFRSPQKNRMELWTAEDPSQTGFLEIRMRVWRPTTGYDPILIMRSESQYEWTLREQHLDTRERIGYFREAAVMDGWEDEDAVPSIMAKYPKGAKNQKKRIPKKTTVSHKSLTV